MTGKTDVALSDAARELASQIHDTANELNRLMRRAAEREQLSTEITVVPVTYVAGGDYGHVTTRCFK